MWYTDRGMGRELSRLFPDTYAAESTRNRNGDTYDTTLIQFRIKNGLASFIKSSQPFQHNSILNESWRCLNCNTINSVYQNRKETRKTCSKCKRTRNNKLTCKEELEAIKICGDNYPRYLEEINKTL